MPAMTPFFHGFGDELVKLSATRGAKHLRKLLSEGKYDKAHKLAKKPGFLPARQAIEPIKHEGRMLSNRRTSGSSHKAFGSGQDQAVTGVFDSQFGSAVRKTRHGKSIVPASSASGRHDVYKELEKVKSTAAPKYHGTFASGPAGVRSEYHGLAPGVTSERALARASQSEKAAINVAVRNAKREVTAAGRRSGHQIHDMNSRGNVMVHKKNNKWTAQVVDFNTKPTILPPGNAPNPKSVTESIFNPNARRSLEQRKGVRSTSVEDHERALEKARGTHSKVRAGEGDFFSDMKGKSGPTKKKLTPEQQAIEDFLNKPKPPKK
jgi:hypothetical protein